MALNEDGLEAGAPVDFDTLKRIQREQRKAVTDGTTTDKPRRGRKPKKAVHTSDDAEL